MSGSDLKRDFLKVLLLPALTFLLVPLGSIGFARYGESKIDQIILDSIDVNIAADATMSPDDKQAATAFYRQHPPSSVCADPDPQLEKYREAVCQPGSETWQFT
jgi:hypothetical protein